MRDWEREAQRRLENTNFPAAGRDEVARELADYLEEVSSDAQHRGLKESVSEDRAFTELHEDPHLGANLFRVCQEGNMNDRTKRLWLPGFCILLMTEAVLYSVQLGRFDYLLWLGQGHRWRIAINLPWLCALPVLGAVAAYWSRRNGAGRDVQVAAGLFPLLVFFGNFFGGPGVASLPVRLAFGQHSWGMHQLMVMYLPWILLGWVIIPLAALLLGVLSVLSQSNASLRPAPDA
ncbi:MAG TPA: hypothetical protein VKB26_11240 [Candidatus Acidoferrales bacterium]|nr:hypothetical protein [Candidatus Acidoferrales bacterium]